MSVAQISKMYRAQTGEQSKNLLQTFSKKTDDGLAFIQQQSAICLLKRELPFRVLQHQAECTKCCPLAV